jgi:redox-sensitive bicupin YhaK (pirin superfamily)
LTFLFISNILFSKFLRLPQPRHDKESTMTVTLRPSAARGLTDFGWLHSRHSFSFGTYMDPDHMGFGSLRVINDDIVEPGQGFGTHPHRDMEIISIVVEGELEHRDSLGTGSVIRPGEVQRMSAGTGILHSEFNPSPDRWLRFLQIWIEPEAPGLTPSYEQMRFSHDRGTGLVLVGSPDGRDGSVTIHQDVLLHRARLEAGETARLVSDEGRRQWIQVIDGAVESAGRSATAGDGLALENAGAVELAATTEKTDVLVFDLA